MPKKKKKSHAFLKNEDDLKEIQLLEAVTNRAILEPLEDEGLSLGELQSKITQAKNEPVKKTTLAYRISRLRTAGLVRKQTKKITKNEIRSPHLRGWRISQQTNGSYQAELGFEITENGKDALNTIRAFTKETHKVEDSTLDLPQKSKGKKKKKDENENE